MNSAPKNMNNNRLNANTPFVRIGGTCDPPTPMPGKYQRRFSAEDHWGEATQAGSPEEAAVQFTAWSVVTLTRRGTPQAEIVEVRKDSERWVIAVLPNGCFGELPRGNDCVLVTRTKFSTLKQLEASKVGLEIEDEHHYAPATG